MDPMEQVDQMDNAQKPDVTTASVQAIETNECKVRMDATKYLEQGETSAKGDLIGSTMDRPIQFREDHHWSYERLPTGKSEL